MLERELSSRVRLLLMSLALLTMYGLLSLALDPGGNLGSDVGGKSATLTAMAETGSVDVGYWAEGLDPDGSLHPMFGTQRFGDEWVNATTFPMLLTAQPLYELGGLRLALLVPMLGGVFAALAARRLARGLGAVRGDLAFWVVGLGTSAVVYALSFWEHSLGLALMAWGVVFVFEAIDAPSARRGIAAGVCFGLAATMRQEALVYGFVSGLTLLVVSLRRNGVWGTARSAGPMVGATGAVLAANQLLEQRILGEGLRNGRSTTTVGSVGSAMSDRIGDAFLTTFLPFGSSGPLTVLVAILLVGALVVLTTRARNGQDLTIPAAIVGAVYLIVLLDAVVGGLSFMPSLLATTPLAVVGATIGLRPTRSRPLVLLAVMSLPVVWSVQYTGGLAAQWGGRYLLLSGWILAVVACSMAESTAVPQVRVVVRGVAALGVLVAAVGISWSVQRTHVTAEAGRALDSLDAPIVVFWSSLDSRQAGAIATENHWLAAEDEADRTEAAGIIGRLDAPSFAYVDLEFIGDVPDFPGFVPTGEQAIPYLSGFSYRVTTFEPQGPVSPE